MYMHVFACIWAVSCCMQCLTFLSAVSLGCIHDDVRSEPGSWLVVGMIPVFDKKKSMRGPDKRPKLGPDGAPRRRIDLTHQCLGALLEGWNALTENNKIIQWADGVWRRTRILLAALFMDQPEADTYCCDTSQSCKLCHCPKSKLHEPAAHPPKYGRAQELKVLRAADGLLTVEKHPKRLFTRNGRVWKPTAECTQALYERQREALNGTHIMQNALWGITGFDVQQCVSLSVCVCICMYVHCICMYYTCAACIEIRIITLSMYFVCMCMYCLCMCLYVSVYA
jgi:hypothetical protein